MRILLIDNGTIHLDELKNILKGHQVTTETKAQLSTAENFDLVILSGSSESPVVTNPKLYEKEIELIRTTATPILGICMGFEIIAYAFGATLKELNQQETKITDIVVTGDDPIFNKNKTFSVAERHRWAVTSVKKPLVELAISKDGIEALKHESKLIYGFQFHPEIFEEKNSGITIFNNLLYRIMNS